MLGARILVVEDDEVLCELILRNLEVRGHEVYIAEDGQEALAYLRTTPFDLIILDINLPDETGWEVLRTAQKAGWLPRVEMDGKDGNSRQLPVVVLSAVRVSSSRLQEFHPLAYLPKPFPMDALLRLAAEAAQHRNGEAVVEQEDAESSLNALTDEEEDLYAS